MVEHSIHIIVMGMQVVSVEEAMEQYHSCTTVHYQSW